MSSEFREAVTPPYLEVRYRDLVVSYLPELDGGGRGFGQQFLKVVADRIGAADHVFEFCAGPGFIGFSLLAHGFCKHLTLADVNPKAVAACLKTVSDNDLQSRVTVYQSDALDEIPDSERWDLVVSNPPHIPGDEDGYRKDIRLVDPGLFVHRKFYRDIHKFLKPDGLVLMQENERGYTVEDFRPLIEEGGLEVSDVFRVGLIWWLGFRWFVPFDVLSKVLSPIHHVFPRPTEGGSKKVPPLTTMPAPGILTPGAYFIQSRLRQP